VIISTTNLTLDVNIFGKIFLILFLHNLPLHCVRLNRYTLCMDL